MLAKSRLVVQGFKDKCLGQYRRDAPTASRLAQSMVLLVAAAEGYTLWSGDVKNGYFNGVDIQREVYVEQPKGGLPGLQKGQLLKAKKAIYGFAEAARHFWLAVRQAFEKAGFKQSRLEDAFFYKRSQGRLVAVA